MILSILLQLFFFFLNRLKKKSYLAKHKIERERERERESITYTNTTKT